METSELKERARELYELTMYYENRLVPYEYRKSLLEFLEEML